MRSGFTSLSTIFQSYRDDGRANMKKVNIKVQGVPQSQTADAKRKKKNDKNYHVENKETNAREAHRRAPSSPSEVITMTSRTLVVQSDVTDINVKTDDVF